MAKILIIADHDGAVLNPTTAKTIACAAEIADAEIDVAVFAESASGPAAEAAALASVHRVLTVERPENARPLAAVLAPQVAAIADGYSHVFGPSTTFGKDLMPRVAALLGVNQISDIMAVVSPYEFQRPVYAGSAIVTVSAAPDRTVVATVRAASYRAVGPGGPGIVAAGPGDEVALTAEPPAGGPAHSILWVPPGGQAVVRRGASIPTGQVAPDPSNRRLTYVDTRNRQIEVMDLVDGAVHAWATLPDGSAPAGARLVHGRRETRLAGRRGRRRPASPRGRVAGSARGRALVGGCAPAGWAFARRRLCAGGGRRRGCPRGRGHRQC